jgi:hypothetical protein
MFAGLDVNGVGLAAPALTWDAVERLKKLTSMKVVLKGIETREDAELACQHGADGLIVSNHGSRAEESGRATIECRRKAWGGAGAFACPHGPAAHQ